MSSAQPSRSSNPHNPYFYAPIPGLRPNGLSSQRVAVPPLPHNLLPRPPSPRQHVSPYAPLSPDAFRHSAMVPLPQPGMSEPISPIFSAQTKEVLARIKEKKETKSVERDNHNGIPAPGFVPSSTVKDLRIMAAPTRSTGTTTQQQQQQQPDADVKTGGRRGRGPRRRGSPAARRTTKVENRTAASPLSVKPPINRGSQISKGRGRRGGRGGSGGGGGRGGKRKREEEDEDQDEEEDGKEDTDASETFTPLPTQSRSGRKIFQATTFMPVVVVDDEHVGPSPSLLTPAKMAPGCMKKRRGGYRRPAGAAAVCKNCWRGHSPSSNAIVFCDGCNTPWHQYCHDPPIKGELLQIEEQEWLCADCGVLREEKIHLEGKVAGEGMGFVEKREYLRSLPQPHLVSLLLHACALHPSLPVFAPQPPPVSSILHPIPNPNLNPSSAAIDPAAFTSIDLAEEAYYYEEEDVLPYPKAGNGVPLPPEVDDLAFLLDEDVRAFSHSWKEEGTGGMWKGAMRDPDEGSVTGKGMLDAGTWEQT